MSLDLLIVHPGAAHGIYGALGDTLVAVEPPLWARLIAGYCRDRGWTVSIVDAEAMGASPDAVAHIVEQEEPRLVCLAVYGHQPSASTQQMHGAGLTARAIKKLWPDAKILMLGGHPSALPERTMDEEAVDYVCVGEGPITVEVLLRDTPIVNVPGLVWDGDGVYVQNQRAPLIENLSELRGDAWDLLPMSQYVSHNWQAFGDISRRQPYASIYTSLGCPMSCSFCCINAPFGKRRYRTRPPANVVSEVRMLHDTYGVSTLKITDEMFVLNPRHYGAICEGLAALPFADELNIWSYARVDTVKPPTLSLLRRAGIRWLALGIESGSAYVRDGARKDFKNSDIHDVVRSIQAAGINVIGNFIVGLPDDDTESMEATYQLAASLNCEFMNVYSAQAYPGSPLYDEAVREGWTLPSSWRGFSQHNDECRPLDTRHVSGADVLRFRDEFFLRYFSSPRYQDMIGARFGEETLAHVRGMTQYRLERKLLAA